MPVAHLTQEGNWVIAKNFRFICGDGISGTRSRSIERTRQVFDVWSESGWTQQRMMAKTFASKEDAQKFLDEHPELY